ncbi:MAG: Flp pilus assembly protein CpaB [Alphaproteobacteria bacterium]|nr:Flp pilus assembly protein CpaB [Alphaproteobacteria bacterium]
MPARKIILLAVALLIAGGTVFIARSMMTGAPGSATDVAAQKAPPTQEILVAAHDLPAGTLLKDADLKWQIWPASEKVGEDDKGPGFAVKGKNEMSEYVGSVVRQGLRMNEPLMAGRVVRKNEQGFMAAVLNPGMRAMSISLTPVAGVAGFVFPGDHVDIIVTHTLNRKSESESAVNRKVSETVLTDVRVLALDQKASDQITEPKIAQTATLEVAPKQAETLALAAEMGTLALALRSIENPPQETPAASAAMPPLDAAALTPDPGIAIGKDSALTWDSDVSQVLDKPANRNGAVQHIQILRGKDASEATFDLRQ